MSDDLPAIAPVSSPKRFTRIRKLTGWRRVAIGMWGRPSSPAVYGQQDMHMTQVNALIEQVRAEHDVKVSPVHVFVKSVGDVFREYPDFNVMLRRNRFYRRDTADVFMQVAIKEGAGDLGGIKIGSVDRKTLVDIGREVAERADRVRNRQDKDLEKTKKSMATVPPGLMRFMVRTTDILSNDLGLNLSFVGLKPDAFGGAMVTNIGSFGLPQGYAPLVPAARVPLVFALGYTEDRPVVVDGEVVVRPMATVTGTFDHRIFDGMQIAKLYHHLKQRFERPQWMLDEIEAQT